MRKEAIAVTSFLVAGLVGCNGPLRTGDAPPPAPAVVATENRELVARRSALEPGDAVPEFVLEGQFGRPVSAGELSLGKGGVLLFLPGLDSPAWRPAFAWAERNRTLLRQQGLELLLVSPQTVEANRALSDRRELRVALLSDPASWTARAFGIVSSGARHPASPWAFVLGGDGRIQFGERGLPDAADLIMAAERGPGGGTSLFEEVFQ